MGLLIEQLQAEKEQLRNEKNRYYTERQILYDEAHNMRIFLANKYITGKGIEIGATYLPLPVPHEAKVRYVDIVSEQELYELYPDIRKHRLAHIDIIDDGEKLSTVKDSSQNFVIANHFLEHTVDPIGTLLTFYRVLKREGIMYLCVPDKRYTFDFDRPLTPLKRLIDFHEHPKHAETAKYNLFLEVAEKIEKWPTKKEQTDRAEKLMDQNFSIHYNVWTQRDLLELLLYTTRTYKLKLDIEAFAKNEHEMIVILRKEPHELTRNPNKGEGEVAHAQKRRKNS